MKTIAFFNNKGGVGKTSLVYHLAWMFADRGIKTLAVDLDPQANLTSMFLNEGRLEELWPDGEHPNTVYGAIRPILKGVGDIAQPHLRHTLHRGHDHYPKGQDVVEAHHNQRQKIGFHDL